MGPTPSAPRRYRSKPVAVWLGVLLGALGAHRFYLHGWRDLQGWLLALPTLAGLWGVARLREFGQDDLAGTWLAPWLGLALAAAMLGTLVNALMPDARWDARHNPGQAVRPTRWAPVLGAVLALGLGAVALISAIAYAMQKIFEAGLGPPPA